MLVPELNIERRTWFVVRLSYASGRTGRATAEIRFPSHFNDLPHRNKWGLHLKQSTNGFACIMTRVCDVEVWPLQANLPIAAEVIVRSGKYAEVFQNLRRFVTRGCLPVHEQEEQPGVDELRTTKRVACTDNHRLERVSALTLDCCRLHRSQERYFGVSCRDSYTRKGG